jgi:diguanylate cyclase (GGDEF)-like protein/PAS domain S-box-containing protein
MEDEAERDALIARRLSELAPFVMFVVAPDGTITWASEPVERLFGLTRDQITGTNIFDHVDIPWNADAIDSVAYAMGAQGLQRPMLFRLWRGDGTAVIAEVTANAQRDDPDIAGLAVYARPWDERWGFEQLLDAMADGTPLPDVLDLVLAVTATENLDAQGVFIYDDPASGERRVRGHADLGPAQRAAAPAPGAPWTTALQDGLPCSVPVADLPEPLVAEAVELGHRWCWAWPVFALDGSGTSGCLVLWRKLDEPPDHTCRMTLRRLVRFIALVFRREAMTTALRRAALRDPLTGLGNRSAFFDELADATAHDPHATGSERLIVVVSIDLDGFKPVNDRLGHAAGDDVLIAVADRLRAQVRDDDLVARLGGDEFCILCRNLGDVDAATHLAERIVAALEEPVSTRSGTVHIGASVGVSLCHQGRITAEGLLEAADRAMYEAKANGTGNWRIGDIRVG